MRFFEMLGKAAIVLAKIVGGFLFVIVLAMLELLMFGLVLEATEPIKPGMASSLVKLAIFIGVQLIVLLLPIKRRHLTAGSHHPVNGA